MGRPALRFYADAASRRDYKCPMLTAVAHIY